VYHSGRIDIQNSVYFLFPKMCKTSGEKMILNQDQFSFEVWRSPKPKAKYVLTRRPSNTPPILRHTHTRTHTYTHKFKHVHRHREKRRQRKKDRRSLVLIIFDKDICQEGTESSALKSATATTTTTTAMTSTITTATCFKSIRQMLITEVGSKLLKYINFQIFFHHPLILCLNVCQIEHPIKYIVLIFPTCLNY
jgi:hypothetical protein